VTQKQMATGWACVICLSADPPPILSGCACRGDLAYAHVECRIEAAIYIGSCNIYRKQTDAFRRCQTCDQDFTGSMRLQLAEAMWNRSRDLPEEDRARMLSVTNFAHALVLNGRNSEAEPLYRDALTLKTRVFGAEHPETLAAAVAFAFSLQARNESVEAERVLCRAHVIMSRVLGEEHSLALSCANNLAQCLASQHKYAAAENVLRAMIPVQDRLKGAEHVHSLRSSANLAVALMGQGKHADAETVLLRVFHVQARVCGAGHPDTLSTRQLLRQCLHVQGKVAEVTAILSDSSNLDDLSNAALALFDQGHFTAAERNVRKVLEIELRTLGSEHPNVLKNLNTLASIFRAQRKYGEAETLMAAVLAMHKRLQGLEHPETFAFTNNLLAILHNRGRCLHAQRVGREAQTVLTCMLAEDHPSHFGFKKMLHEVTGDRNHLHAFARSLSTCLSASGKHGEAEAVLREALSVQHRVLGANHPNARWMSEALAQLVQLHMLTGQSPNTAGSVPLQSPGTHVRNGKRGRVVSARAPAGMR
jgi:tetratricopeptide (TPR) repeat protein